MEKYKRVPKEKYFNNNSIMMIPIADAEDSARYTCIINTKSGQIQKEFNVPPIDGNFVFISFTVTRFCWLAHFPPPTNSRKT